MILLASKSPRRREILEKITDAFIVVSSDGDENIEKTEPTQYVRALALRKAEGVDRAAYTEDDLILASDTIVVLDGEILGKPRDRADAIRMLKMLSGRSHMVYTGVALLYKGRTDVFYEGTEVTFRPLTDGLIESYVDSGEPMDKAGSYGIQGKGGRFVQSIHGDYYNVMGLPLCALSARLEQLGVVEAQA